MVDWLAAIRTCTTLLPTCLRGTANPIDCLDRVPGSDVQKRRALYPDASSTWHLLRTRAAATGLRAGLFATPNPAPCVRKAVRVCVVARLCSWIFEEYRAVADPRAVARRHERLGDPPVTGVERPSEGEEGRSQAALAPQALKRTAQRRQPAPLLSPNAPQRRGDDQRRAYGGSLCVSQLARSGVALTCPGPPVA